MEKAKYTRNLEAKDKPSQEVFLEEVDHGLFQKLKKLKSGNLTKSRISAGMGKLWEKVQKKGVSGGSEVGELSSENNESSEMA